MLEDNDERRWIINFYTLKNLILWFNVWMEEFMHICNENKKELFLFFDERIVKKFF